MEDVKIDTPEIKNAFVETPKKYRSESRGLARLVRDNSRDDSRFARTEMRGCAYERQTIVYEPSTYDDVQKLIDRLKSGEQVIVNFANVNETSFYRMIDFMSGAVYALNGKIQKITANIFLFAPYGAKISMPEG